MASAFRRIDGAQFLSDVLPLGAAVLISALYFRIDVYFIQQWHGFQPVGGYNAAFRLVEAMRLLPAAVMAVTFPLLVQSARHRSGAQHRRQAGDRRRRARDRVRARRIRDRAADLRRALRLRRAGVCDLSLALPLFFLNYALTHQVIGWDGHRAYLGIVALALAGNIAANMVLVPGRGIVGAAIATRPHRNGRHRRLRLCAGSARSVRLRRLTTRLQHEGSPT